MNIDIKEPTSTDVCPFIVAYSTNDVIYRWGSGRVELKPGLRLSQFDLLDFPLTNYTGQVKGAIHSVLCVTFKLGRHTGYFVINLYLPCCLLVVLSWVSFWINREATGDRIALGFLTVLTMTILGIENKSQQPKVSYVTALDVYVALCFVFVIATTIQFALVHYFTKLGTGEQIEVSSEEESEGEEGRGQSGDVSVDSLALENGKFRVHDYPWPSPQVNVKLGVLAKFCRCVTGTKTTRRKGKTKGSSPMSTNSVSQVDNMARVIFPVTFLALNLGYIVFYYIWAFSEYYKIDKDEKSSE